MKDLLRSIDSYFHELLVIDKVPIQEILKRYNISYQVLHHIKNERKYSIRTLKMELFELNNWQVLNNLVSALNNWMKRQEYPFSIIEIKHYLDEDLQIVITSKHLYDVVMNEATLLNKISSQPTNSNLDQLQYSRWLFWIRLAKFIDESTLLINIDKTSINYKAKINYCWTQKNKAREFKCKPFLGSKTMIFTIILNCTWFWTFNQGSTNSDVFLCYWWSLKNSKKENNYFGYKKAIVLLNNCSSHRS